MNKIIIADGLKKMSESSISICSIVRDCEKILIRNIQKVEELRKLFLKSEVVVFENDSKDQTPEILKNWGGSHKNVITKSEIFNTSTIPMNTNGKNPFFSKYRIEKMSLYRNKYLEILNSNSFQRDYVIIIDLDISNFSIKGVVHSFGVKSDWSCITANGISLSKGLRRQYHDSYALIEKGCLNHIQSEESIQNNRRKFAFLKTGMPLFPVASAFGGLAIYNWKSLKGKYYSCIVNDNSTVEVLCEHVSINNQLDGDIFINPDMDVNYRAVDLPFLIKYMKN